MTINDGINAFAGLGMEGASARSVLRAARFAGLQAGIEDMNACGRAAAWRGDT